jgi:hypothetical protein
MDETRGRLEIPMQHEGIEVGSVGPHDGAQLLVYPHLSEIAGIGQRLEHRAMQLPGEIDVACAAVAEAKPQLVVTKHVYRGDAYELHAPILRQRVDGLGRTPVLGSLPVCFQLLAVQTRPLSHELERASGETADKHFVAADHNRRMMLGVLGMEVGRIVVVEIHRHDDPVEEADAGHGAIMSAAADGEWPGRRLNLDRTSLRQVGGRPSLGRPPDKAERAPCNKSSPPYCSDSNPRPRGRGPVGAQEDSLWALLVFGFEGNGLALASGYPDGGLRLRVCLLDSGLQCLAAQDRVERGEYASHVVVLANQEAVEEREIELPGLCPGYWFATTIVPGQLMS